RPYGGDRYYEYEPRLRAGSTQSDRLYSEAAKWGSRGRGSRVRSRNRSQQTMKAILSETRVKPIGQMLRERGLVSEEDLTNALALQRERRDKLGKILIDLGYVAERDILLVLSQQLQTPVYDGEYPAVPIATDKLPYRFLKSFHLIPIHFEENVLSVV